MHEKNEFNQIVGYPISNWQAAKRPANECLYGKYCYLEPVDVNKHATNLYEALAIDNAGESWTYLPYGPFNTQIDFKTWLQTVTSEKDIFLYAILNIHTQLPMGLAGYMRITPEHGVIEIGHVHFSNLMKRTPAATEAIYLLLDHAFETLTYRRCEWKCNALNQASRDAAERFGFTFEGTFRQHFVFKNRNRDTTWFSMLDSEWPAIKAKFQTWLHPANFDAQGRQRLSLRHIEALMTK